MLTPGDPFSMVTNELCGQALNAGWGGGRWGVKVVLEGIDFDGTFDLWNISEGCKKNWLFLWGEAGVLCQYL